MTGRSKRNAPAGDLVTLARARFGDLSAAEEKLLEAAPKGEFARCGPNHNFNDPGNDPAKADEWGADREVRAELIRWMCVDHVARERVDPKGIQVFGARISGKLDLSYVAVPFGLTMWRCQLTEGAEFYSTDLPRVDFQGTWVRSFTGDGMTVNGAVILRNDFRAEGEVRLLGARVGGDLTCSDSLFRNPSGVALNAGGSSVKGNIFLRNGFRAEGEVRLIGAEVGGDLDCDNGFISNPSKFALGADRISVKGNVFFRSGFRAEGEVRLLCGQIGGNLTCHNGVFRNPSGVALNADLIRVKGGVFFRENFRAEGEVRLPGAEIGVTLICVDCEFGNPSKDALYADRISVNGVVLLSDGFRAEGAVCLPGAQIDGDFDCTGGTIRGRLLDTWLLREGRTPLA